ncbi:SDR family oxidoreductase [Pikeienuella piscinae]|uniref:SDR family oxidoreductase n=1 Tax=Pikeienuella piscinae TaxID=2748098 RepID=A0A7L5BVV1_9RHOB|nr:D-erythronate dehydrogenase [Pikeienuella piscinae]QIE54346.1 SDR family oxidoreductase [Pikeienuella piscinae]
MRVLITGGGGFLGVKLAKALAKKGEIRGREITHMTQADLFAPEPVKADFEVEGVALDIGDRASVDAAFAAKPDAVFHLAAVVSGQAEAEFDIGLRVNLHGTLNILEAARHAGNQPIVVFTSSVAVYGGEIPDVIDDFTILNPQTSYGAQKAATEMMLTDYSRKGFIDGRGLRLPTVTVRPGKPNAAASSFMSSIFREPLQGESANCPVSEDYPIWFSAPRTVVANLVHAAEPPAEAWGENRCLALPGLTNTVREMVEAMTNVAGSNAAGLITWNPDPFVQKICDGWRAHLKPEKALRLGFHQDKSFEDNIRWFIEDDIRR